MIYYFYIVETFGDEKSFVESFRVAFHSSYIPLDDKLKVPCFNDTKLSTYVARY